MFLQRLLDFIVPHIPVLDTYKEHEVYTPGRISPETHNSQVFFVGDARACYRYLEIQHADSPAYRVRSTGEVKNY